VLFLVSALQLWEGKKKNVQGEKKELLSLSLATVEEQTCARWAWLSAGLAGGAGVCVRL
jgi:hypothetical protein